MENTLNKFAFAKSSFASLVLLAAVAGCHSDQPPKVHGESFVPETQATDLGKINQAQAATGAAADGMLYDMNFHGSKLNSLGEVKLDLIRKGTPAGDPVVVYLSMPHDAVAAREAAVTAYFKTEGLADTQISLVEGANLNGTTTPTAYNITGLYKADGTTFNGQGAVDAGAAAAAGASGGGATATK